MIKYLTNLFKTFDNKLASIIRGFLTSYIFGDNPPFFTKLIAPALKAIFYLTFVLTIFAFLKLFYPYNRLLFLIIISLLFAIGLLIATLFLGFFQIAFS